MSKITQQIWKKLGLETQWFLIWIFHPKFNVGVSVIIRNTDNKILLGKHAFSGKKPWRLIGGYINKNENIFDAAKREAKEELGIGIEIERLLRVRTGFKHRIEFTLVSKPISQQPFILDRKEIHEIAWFEQGQEPADTLDSHLYLLELFRKSPADFVEVTSM